MMRSTGWRGWVSDVRNRGGHRGLGFSQVADKRSVTSGAATQMQTFGLAALTRRLQVGILFLLSMQTGPALADATVTATGSVFCFDGDTGVETALVGARVELMDSDCDGSQICDDEMNTQPSYVDANGLFTVTGRGGDPLGGDPDVYVRIALTDDVGVRMTDEIGITRSFSTHEHGHNNTPDGAIIDFGRITSGQGSGNGESARCAVWSAVHNVFQAYIGEVDEPPPAGYLDIQYWSAIWAGVPWTNTDTVHWPINFPSAMAAHEFGHSIRHAADGSAAHFTNDVVRFRYARNHDDGCAADENAQPGELLASVRSYNFNEGWADYWEGAVDGCGGGIMTEWVELQVARQLHVWQTGFGLTRGQMVNVLRDNPGAIHDTAEFAEKLRSGLGVQAFALTPEQLAADKKGASTSRVRTSYSQARRAELIRQQLADINETINKMTRAQTAATLRAPCRGAECEALFKAIVGPVMSAGQRRVLDEQRRALKQALSPKWQESVQRRLSTGAFDEWLLEYRATRQRSIRTIMLQAVRDSEAALARARPKFADAYTVYAAEVLKARKRLEASADGTRAGAFRRSDSWLPQANMGTDRIQ